MVIWINLLMRWAIFTRVWGLFTSLLFPVCRLAFCRCFSLFLLRLGLRRDYVDILQIPFSLVYAGLTGFSVSVVRSLIQSGLGNIGVKRLDNLALTMMILFCIMPNFLLTTGGILSFTYAFILSFIDFVELESYQKKIVECLAISLGSLPILIYFFQFFNRCPFFWQLFFIGIWYAYVASSVSCFLAFATREIINF